MKEDFRFYHKIRVRYNEVDRQNVVFNGVYLTYFSVGFTEYLRHYGVNYSEAIKKGDWDVVVASIKVDYKSPAHFDDVLDIYIKFSEINRRSIISDFEIYKESTDNLTVKGNLKYVILDPKTGKSKAVPEEMKEKSQDRRSRQSWCGFKLSIGFCC